MYEETMLCISLTQIVHRNCTFFRFTEMDKIVKPLYFCFECTSGLREETSYLTVWEGRVGEYPPLLKQAREWNDEESQ